MFDFSWSSAGSTAESAGAVGSAAGTFVLDVLPDAMFESSDLIAFDVTVMTTNVSVVTFGLADVIAFSGSLDGDDVGAFDDFALRTNDSDFSRPRSFFGLLSDDVLGFCTEAPGMDNCEELSDVFTYLSEDGAAQSLEGSAAGPSVSEPATLALLGMGVLGLGYMRKRSA